MGACAPRAPAKNRHRSRALLETFDADVAGLEIAAEVAVARESVVGQTVDDRRDANVASPSTGTPAIELLADVQLTAELAVVFGQTATEPHSAVVCSRHQNDFVVSLTTRMERLALAIFVHLTIR